LADTGQLGRIHGYLPKTDDHAEVVDLLSIEGTFLGFQEKGFFADDFKDTVGSFLVFFKGFRKYKNVVHVDDHPSFSDFFLEGLVHVGLERGRGIAQAEEHYFWFKESEGCGESRFPEVIRVNQDVVISRSDVHLREEFRIA
jgi:hypothetical protein